MWESNIPPKRTMGSHTDALFSARRDQEARHGSHEAIHGGGCGRWPASPAAARGRMPGGQASLCVMCLQLVSKHDFKCFKKQNTETKTPNKTTGFLRGNSVLHCEGTSLPPGKLIDEWLTRRFQRCLSLLEATHIPVSHYLLSPHATAWTNSEGLGARWARHELAVIWASTELIPCPQLADLALIPWPQTETLPCPCHPLSSCVTQRTCLRATQCWNHTSLYMPHIFWELI